MAATSNPNYFVQLNSALKNHHRAIPFLLIDLDVVDQNIETFKANLKQDANPRIVVKSLPAPQLIQYISNKVDTNRFMVFHQPFLSHLAAILDNKADILLGKPLPIKTARYFYDNFSESNTNFNPYTQIQWLIDTKERALKYIELAKELNQPLRLNLEIDIGLHRGGFNTTSKLHEVLTLIERQNKHAQFSGLMGYDPHIVKIPKILRSQKKSLDDSFTFYNACKKLIQEEFPQLWNDNLTFNGAGSPTINLHNTTTSPLNDIAAGSCFVKPTTFDISSLSNYKAACFIATPVLKKMNGTTVPGIERFKSVLNVVNSNNAHSYFIYGGFWKADYVYPAKTKANSLYGNSTNQTMINAPSSAKLEVDDFVFLRPHQSEFVFLQFGKLTMLRNAKIVDEWELLNNN